MNKFSKLVSTSITIVLITLALIKLVEKLHHQSVVNFTKLTLLAHQYDTSGAAVQNSRLVPMSQPEQHNAEGYYQDRIYAITYNI